MFEADTNIFRAKFGSLPSSLLFLMLQGNLRRFSNRAHFKTNKKIRILRIVMGVFLSPDEKKLKVALCSLQLNNQTPEKIQAECVECDSHRKEA